MFKFTCILAAAAASLLLVSCGSDDDKAAIGSALDGTWKMTDSNGMINTETYSGSTLTREGIDSGSNVRYVSTMTFTAGDAVTVPAGAKKIDLTVADITMTCLTEAGVQSANAASYYGYSDWALNVTKSIAGKRRITTEDPEYSKTQVVYSVYKIDGNSFYHGDSDTGDETSDAKRPTALETTPYIRQ